MVKIKGPEYLKKYVHEMDLDWDYEIRFFGKGTKGIRVYSNPHYRIHTILYDDIFLHNANDFKNCAPTSCVVNYVRNLSFSSLVERTAVNFARPAIEPTDQNMEGIVCKILYSPLANIWRDDAFASHLPELFHGWYKKRFETICTKDKPVRLTRLAYDAAIAKRHEMDARSYEEMQSGLAMHNGRGVYGESGNDLTQREVFRALRDEWSRFPCIVRKKTDISDILNQAMTRTAGVLGINSRIQVACAEGELSNNLYIRVQA